MQHNCNEWDNSLKEDFRVASQPTNSSINCVLNTALAPAKFKQTLHNLITVKIQEEFNIWIPVKYIPLSKVDLTS